MPNPIDVHTLRSFIGLCNYYKIYVRDFNTITHPFYALLKKDIAYSLGVGITHQNANTMLRRPLTTSKDFSEVMQDFN
jgi:hypothetical protein